MSNGRPLKDILRPIAKGLVHLFYERVEQSADTQNNAEWTFDHYNIVSVPLNYRARLKLTLEYTGTDTPPKRRADDKRGWIAELTNDESIDK
jgi:hypothetical protein